MRFHEFSQSLTEAGEPKSPSRRGFLKAMGAAAATAAMPKQALGLAKTLAQPAAAAAPAVAKDMLTTLFQTAAGYGADRGYQAPFVDYNKNNNNDYDDDYDDENPDNNIDNDNDIDDIDDEGNWKTEFDQPQGKTGRLPWDEGYEVNTSAKGRQYLVTSSPDGQSTIVTYVKDNTPQIIELDWDSTGRDHELFYSDADENLVYAWMDSDADQTDFGSLVDTLIDEQVPSKGKFEKPQSYNNNDFKNQGQQSGSSSSSFSQSLQSGSNVLSDLAVIRRLAGLTGLSWLDKARDVVQDMVQKEIQEIRDLMSQPSGSSQTAAKPASMPALPAPDQLQNNILSDLQSQMGRNLTDFEETVLKAEIQQELNKMKSQQ